MSFFYALISSEKDLKISKIFLIEKRLKKTGCLSCVDGALYVNNKGRYQNEEKAGAHPAFSYPIM